MKIPQKILNTSVLFFVIAFTVLCAFKIKDLKFNYDFEAFFPNEDNELGVYETHRNRFEWDNEFVLLGIENKAGIFNKHFLQKVSVEKDKILNINVNLSGRVNPDLGYSYSIFNFDERPLTDVISEKVGGYRVSIDNDTRAMIYGEYMQGVVKGEKNIIFINVSWGLGMGIIIDGKIYKGKSGFSGEFGHNFGYENEIICHCGKKGCIETEVSGAALHRILLEHINNGENSIISNTKKNLEDLTLDDIIDAVNKEDLLCIELVEEIGVKLGRHVAGLINIFNPELVIIGGALSRTGDYLTQPITTAIRKYTLNLMNRDSVIVESKLKERAGIIGACMLSRSKLFE